MIGVEPAPSIRLGALPHSICGTSDVRRVLVEGSGETSGTMANDDCGDSDGRKIFGMDRTFLFWRLALGMGRWWWFNGVDHVYPGDPRAFLFLYCERRDLDICTN